MEMGNDRTELGTERYREPAQISFVLREEVSEAKSPLSKHATFNPRAAASSAHPAPVAPPPTIRTS